MEWLDPWFGFDPGSDSAAAYVRQLRAEIGPGHPLHGLEVVAAGKHGGCDDAAYQVLDGSGRVAVVHLTWSRNPDQRYWPAAEFYPNLEAFAAERMLPDHEGFAE